MLFEGVAKIEKEHEERYRKLIQNIEDGVVFSKDGDCVWFVSLFIFHGTILLLLFSPEIQYGGIIPHWFFFDNKVFKNMCTEH